MSDSWLYVVVPRQKSVLWMAVGYMNLCVLRELNCG